MIMNCLKACLFVAILTVIPTGAGATSFPPLFDTVEYRSASLAALPQWRRVLNEIAEETPIYQGCANAEIPCEPRALLAWQAMLKGQEGNDPVGQLRAVNRFVNRWEARTDQENYEKMDYWASPLTFLKHSGDCEDHAIMKYVSLRQLGFDAEQLRLVVVRDVLRDLAHAVLAVHVEEDVFILDNQFQAVLPQHMVSQYLPYYSVNENARFSHLPPSGVLMASSPFDITPSMGPVLDVDVF